MAGDSLKEQMEFAKEKVPEKERSQTRVYLMATAGLRKLDKSIQEAVLDSCRQVLRASSFWFQDEWASVITGMYAGTFTPKLGHKVGVVRRLKSGCGKIWSSDRRSLFLNSKVNVVVTRHSKLLTVNFCKRNLDIGIEPPRIGRAQNFWWISW